MKFECALKAMREGKKVTLWYNQVFYIKDGELRVDDISSGEVDYPVLLDGNDILADDWEVVDERT
jgi:hypothetical protein